MAQIPQIEATDRDVVGKANRRIDSRHLPAVIYGAGVTSRPIAVDRHGFEQMIAHDEGFASRLMRLSIEGEKPVNVIVKALQRDAATSSLLHVDFWAVAMTQTISTTVPVHFQGESPGVKAGGIIMHNLQHVQIEALPGDLPDAVTGDISSLEVGDSLHVSDLVAPSGVTIMDPPDEIVASIVTPAKIEEEVLEVEAEQPEVIGEEEQGE
jgi:large subunit ribosomal protein L25